MSVTIRLALIAAAMTAFLGYLVISHATARANGTEIVLNVRGYDPRDIFLGHFSLITTELQQLDAAMLEGEDEFESGDALYVVLTQNSDGVWQPVSLHRARPDTGLFIHGIVRSSYQVETEWTDPQTGETLDQPEERIWVYSAFNIERYYASRDMAQQFDQHLRELNEDGETGVRLILSVPANGDAIIKGFEIDGERRIDRLW